MTFDLRSDANRRRRARLEAPALLPATLAAGALLVFSAVWAQAETREVDSSAGPISIDRIATLSHPWGMDFLPDGRVIATERDGRLVLIDPGAEEGERIVEISGAPEVAARGQGGLLDVTVAPDFAESGRVFLSYAAAAPGGARTAVDRAVLRLDGAPRLADLETIFAQEPALPGGRHFGSRVVVAPDGALFITTGDRGDPDRSQELDGHVGKVIRIMPDGAIPADNPFLADAAAEDAIWSYGHRNIQGAAIRPEDGALWTVEHGARGGDEINRPLAGLNYGWPVISYGRHYSGGKIGVGDSADGMEQPVHYWDPSIAPSGLVFYDGALFPDWRGDLLVGALKFQLVSRLEMSGDRVVGEELLFASEIGRIRDLDVGPDGAIWLLTDETDGGLWRAAPSE